MPAKNLDYYLALNYTYQIAWDEESEAYGGQIVELPGCVATGETPAETLEALDEAKQAYLEVALAEGWEIPEPAQAADYSGRVLLRMASTLHMQLARWAEQEGVSLNQLLVTALAHAAGTRLALPAQAGESVPQEQFNQEFDDRLLQARREIERGAECEVAFAPLREFLLSNYEKASVARSFLSLVDLASHAYHLAEIRTRQKEVAEVTRFFTYALDDSKAEEWLQKLKGMLKEYNIQRGETEDHNLLKYYVRFAYFLT